LVNQLRHADEAFRRTGENSSRSESTMGESTGPEGCLNRLEVWQTYHVSISDCLTGEMGESESAEIRQVRKEIADEVLYPPLGCCADI